ncbi:MAG: rRNA maturation RNase YbeY [Gammaproteobacteria bacterium]|jgi:probable rRNA maturation factor|nr:rRNA maturation RNase YbeY [Gammaproteobacteria bacterium]MCP4879427.1 rRNA maturation RNase YbeY [Gammaproteobacteria bacterium]MDP6165410.1 rRNA maturation RNase YbeY [Gammaproteobacteria bacterium]
MIDLQIATQEQDLPSHEQFQQWVSLASEGQTTQSDITIRLVDDAESQQLNADYRGKNQPTNVLSFPAQMDEFEAEFSIPELIEEAGGMGYLGDLVINAAIVKREALQQNKEAMEHWAHLVIHGCLHLQGYDHIEDDEAEQMEGLEIALLAAMGIANPYC